MLFDLRFAPKRFGPLMFVKVILSHSQRGLPRRGRRTKRRNSRRRWRCDTGTCKKTKNCSLPKTKYCFQSLTGFLFGKKIQCITSSIASFQFSTVDLLPFISVFFICQGNKILPLSSPWYAILIVSLRSCYNSVTEGRQVATIFTVWQTASLFTGLIEFCRKSMVSGSPAAALYLGWLCATWRNDSIKQTQLPFNSRTNVFAAGAATGRGDTLYNLVLKLHGLHGV